MGPPKNLDDLFAFAHHAWAKEEATEDMVTVFKPDEPNPFPRGYLDFEVSTKIWYAECVIRHIWIKTQKLRETFEKFMKIWKEKNLEVHLENWKKMKDKFGRKLKKIEKFERNLKKIEKFEKNLTKCEKFEKNLKKNEKFEKNLKKSLKNLR